MIKVQQTIEVYELDGKYITTNKERLLIGVDSHWKQSRLIVLVVGEHRYAVVCDDLLVAVKNAQNTNRY